MAINTTIGDPVAFVESRFGIRLRRDGPSSWHGPCPWCGGRDRFIVWARGTYLCRPGAGHCGRAGWLDEIDGIEPPSELDLIKWRLDALERKQQEHERRLSALESMHRCTDHLVYHANLVQDGQGVDYWFGEGIVWQTIEKYQLGWCPACPTYPLSASYTIPVMAGGRLFNIRHRLASTDGGSKYRPHMAGLPTMIFNADDLQRHAERQILILEGEKKSIVVAQETGRPNVAIMGCGSFSPAWVPKFDRWHTVLVCLDPDADEKARQIAALFGERGRVVTLPAKADDLFVRFDATPTDFAAYIADAGRVH